ncbi:hypothetical protein SAMN02745194_05023 [Roseomonas rosea]|uniref:Uncharacterized protein n=1 Tax=Muricoccus roseus TaxID=198092 RepID=A0A1M6SWN3_9PROT|nr:hypothetical protein [Roseomonas rosea]SHK48978.1 hypothetical protein SAMN02745194_05023 [Roseomonas rosea]
MSETFIDHAWYGAPAAMAAALAGQANVIGPLVLDGVAYATVRAPEPLPQPPGVLTMGPQLSRVLHGSWMGDAAPVPAEVTNFQARTALRHAGLFEDAETIVETKANMLALAGDELGAETLREAWVKASFVRTSPLIAELATVLQLTPEQLDDLFRAAAAVSV